MQRSISYMLIHPHQVQWKADFIAESDKVREVFVGDIELYHVGSTAIEGLYAKNCIDILGVVNNLSDAQNNIKSLEKLEYIYKGEYGIQGREYFTKYQRYTHLHIFTPGNINIQVHLKFVQVMQGNLELIEELNELKIKIKEKYPNDKNKYQVEKKAFYDKLKLEENISLYEPSKPQKTS